MKNILLVFAVFVAIALMGTKQQTSECDELKKENEKLKVELTKQEKIAATIMAEAERQRALAEQARKAAEEAHQKAKSMTDAASEEAQRQAKIAMENAKKAAENALEAEKQRKLAEECAKKN